MLSPTSSTDRRVISGSFTANNQTAFVKDVSDYNNILLMVQGSYGNGLSIAWECSMDGVAWVGVQGMRTDTPAQSASFALIGNQKVAFFIYVGGFNYFRVNSTAWLSPAGSADVWCAGIDDASNPAIMATIASAAPVSCSGASAHSSTQSAQPVPVAGRVSSIADSTLLNNDACHLTMSTAGQLVTKDFAGAELDFNFSAPDLTTTTTPAQIAAAGSGILRNYVTAIQAINTHATQATKLMIVDGSTVTWKIQLPANMPAPLNVVFPTPLRGSAATALSYNFSAAGATVDLNVQGYKSA